jgi:S-adenosyl-L-methionine hydrolase (adenosine-forming)
MAKQTIVTFLTDFGTQDGYAASMKGVLLSMAPSVRLVDITHEINLGDVLAGAFVLNQVIDYFPPGTIHLGVIDPAAGTDRRILAARYAGQIVIAPDNVLITMVDQRLGLEAIVSVRNERFFLASRIGRTFDGRDIMAPVAGALAQGARLDQLGPAPDSYKLLDLPPPRVEGSTLVGQVLHIDRFGNCVTNIRRSMIEQVTRNLAKAQVYVGERSVGPLSGAFAHVSEGEVLALLDCIDLLEIAVNCGRASDRLNLRIGDEVQVRYVHSDAVTQREAALGPQALSQVRPALPGN